ncbi:hypothetical protein MBLNU230_g4535t1 [Neophaeotheca triangularis]
MPNPFSVPSITPGEGTIHLALLPPNTPRLKTLKYQYPLKLIAPAPTALTTSTNRDQEPAPKTLIHTIYLLTYGGGIVASDTLNLSLHLESSTRLVLLTQGSTKIFKTADAEVLSRQVMTTRLERGAGVCYLPDPVQPFECSSFEQRQVWEVPVVAGGGGGGGASVCVLDWVSSGRAARGEEWGFWRYGSLNEVWVVAEGGGGGGRRLLLRDNVSLDARDGPKGMLADRMYSLEVFGTLILHGPLVELLGQFFMREFQLLPRLGGRGFASGGTSRSGSGSGEDDFEVVPSPREKWRTERQRWEAKEGVLWTAASLRGCVVVKFGAPSVEVGRQWVRDMLVEEGSVEAGFGERALLCLK